MLEAAEQWAAELVQAGVRELHLGLDAGRPDDAASGGSREEVLQQLGLADAWLAAQDQGRTAPGPGARQEVVEGPALVSPPEESGS
jgi:hypothetical protein